MPTYARSIGGSTGGLGIIGTQFAIKSEQFRLRINQELSEVSGFGDGGNSYWSPGKNEWDFQVTGFLYTGTFGTAGVTHLTGTNAVLVSATFTSDTGRTYTGSARVNQIVNTTTYQNQSGFVGISLTGRGEGALTEA